VSQQDELYPDAPCGFSPTKGDPNYWLDTVRDMWTELGVDTDESDLLRIVNYVDAKRLITCQGVDELRILKLDRLLRLCYRELHKHAIDYTCQMASFDLLLEEVADEINGLSELRTGHQGDNS